MPETNIYKPSSAWKLYARETERLEMGGFADKYLEFISECKTERETIAWIKEKLLQAGYGESLSHERGFQSLRGKALFAFRRGAASLESGLNLIAAHVDSPRLDFKQRPLIEQAGVAQAKTHYYGGLKKYQWLARPLALRGVVSLANGENISLSLGDNKGDPVFCIADLLPHLAQKQASQKVSEAFEGEKLNVIIGHEPALKDDEEQEAKAKEPILEKVLEHLNKNYGIIEEDLITAELEAVPAGRARYVGLDKALLGGYGQDDRICVFCALEAFLAGATQKAPASNVALVFWDKEEIGSDGASGASSNFFQYCVEDLASGMGVSASRTLLNSRAISADVTAGLDPDYQDVHEKHNAAILGYGPSFSKFTGSRGKYGASEADAEFFASLRGLFNARGIPWQAAELGKVDLGGGGTVALFLARYGMSVIDLGPALLSMHSPFELSSVADLYATYLAYRSFLES